MRKFDRELDECSTKSNVREFDNHWNCFLLDISIRDLMVNKLGFALFDGMTGDAKRALYWDYLGRKLPIWEKITQ